jgi:hypothetical protein
MEARSRPAVAVSLLLLGASAGLGILVHDAEIGGPEANQLAPGDEVRIKGEAHAISGEPPVPGAAFWLESEQWDGMVLVTEPPHAPRDGVWVVTGSVQAIEPWHVGRLLIVEAAAVTAPLLFD